MGAMKGSKAVKYMTNSAIAKSIAQDPCEACHQSWQKGGLWQGGDGEGKASKDRCEGIPCICHQEVHLEHCWCSECSKVNQAAMLEYLLLAVGDLRNEQGS